MSSYITMAKRIWPLAQKFGPKALVALTTLSTLVDKNPQAKKFIESVNARLKSKGRIGQTSTQIELAKEFATEAMTDETLPERQEVARLWVQRAKVQEMALRAARNMPHKTARARRAEVAEKTDALLADIIEIRGKWSES
jgi:hypothetical protein